MGLRIGILLDREHCFAWEAAMIERIGESDGLELCWFLVTGTSPATTTPGFLLRLYRVFDRALFRARPDPLRRIVLSSVSPATPRVKLPRRVLEGHAGDGDAGQSAAMPDRADILVDLTGDPVLSTLRAKARLGVWKHRVGSGRSCNEAGFLEMVEKIPILKASLEAELEGEDGTLVIARTWSRVDPLSVNRSRAIAFWKCAVLVPRELAKLSRLGENQYLKAIRERNIPSQLEGLGTYPPPSFTASLAAVVRQVWRLGAKVVDKLFFRNQWILACSFGEPLSSPLQSYRRLIPPSDRFWADPHIITRDGERYLFFEELPFATGKGHIAAGRLEKDGTLSEPAVVLRQPYHLSYPFVFHRDGTYYMIPETSQNRTIELYECSRFPDEWVLKQVLMRDVRAVDATVVPYQGKWWMFTNMAEREGLETLDELFLFFADDFPTDAWTPHPLNPVVSDIRGARPAGRVFEHQGSLIRPSQDCSDGYGAATNLNRIVTLSERDYDEIRLESVRPSWDPRLIGLHTVSVDQGLTVIDLCARRWKFGAR